MGGEDYCINIILDIFNPLIVVIEAPNNAKSISGSVLTEETELQSSTSVSLPFVLCSFGKTCLGGSCLEVSFLSEESLQGDTPSAGMLGQLTRKLDICALL